MQNSIRLGPKIKMVDVKPDIGLLVPEIADGRWNCNEIRIFWRFEKHGGTNVSTVRRQGEWEIKDGGINRKWIWNNVYLSLYTLLERDYNGYIPMFSGSNNMTALFRRLSRVRVSGISKMGVVTGSTYELTYISACIHDSNEIKTDWCTYNFGVKKHDWTSPKTVLWQGEWYIYIHFRLQAAITLT